jgi:hypothetical protein
MSSHASHMDPYTYILVDRVPVQHANDDEWVQWYLDVKNRRVDLTKIGDVTISTVFGGLDIMPEKGMFETQIFGGEHGGDVWRAATWDEAERRHAEAVALVRG